MVATDRIAAATDWIRLKMSTTHRIFSVFCLDVFQFRVRYVILNFDLRVKDMRLEDNEWFEIGTKDIHPFLEQFQSEMWDIIWYFY